MAYYSGKKIFSIVRTVEERPPVYEGKYTITENGTYNTGGKKMKGDLTVNVSSPGMSAAQIVKTDEFTSLHISFRNNDFISFSFTKSYNDATSNVDSCFEMFYGCNSLKSIDFSNFDSSRIFDMRRMFEDCKSLTSLDLSNLDVRNVREIESMFNGCSNLESLNLSGWDVRNFPSGGIGGELFYGCDKLTSINLSNSFLSRAFMVVTMNGMHSIFSGAKNLNELNLHNANVSAITDMSYLFSGITNLHSLDLSSFDTSNVTDMSYMFSRCSKLSSINLSNFDTSKVTNMTDMFAACNELTSLDVSNFDTSKVTSMAGMFSAVYGYDIDTETPMKLTTIKGLSTFNTSKVIYMSLMFAGCVYITSLDLSSFDTSKVEDMGYMFAMCMSLTSLDLSNFDTSSIITPDEERPDYMGLANMFYGCTSLASLRFPSSVSFDIEDTALAHDALVVLLNDLKSVTTTQTLTMGSSKLALLSDAEKKIATDKGWTLA